MYLIRYIKKCKFSRYKDIKKNNKEKTAGHAYACRRGWDLLLPISWIQSGLMIGPLLPELGVDEDASGLPAIRMLAITTRNRRDFTAIFFAHGCAI
jgi:hypothetical protein